MVHILPAAHQKHHFRSIGQQQVGLFINSRPIAQNLQSIWLVVAEHHLAIAKDISVLHDKRATEGVLFMPSVHEAIVIKPASASTPRS